MFTEDVVPAIVMTVLGESWIGKIMEALYTYHSVSAFGSSTGTFTGISMAGNVGV